MGNLKAIVNLLIRASVGKDAEQLEFSSFDGRYKHFGRMIVFKFKLR
jgi:hypothetical protein